MKKVVHLMPFYDVPGRSITSGAENHLLALMEGQVAAGWAVELAMVVGVDGARLDVLAESLRAKGMTVSKILFPLQGLGQLSRIGRLGVLPRLVRYLKAQPVGTVIHSHIITPGSHLFVLAAWWAGCKALVSSYHNNEPWLANFTFRWRLQLMDKVTRRTIAISKAVQTHLVLNVGLSPSRTRLVYYGLELPTAPPERTALRQRLGVAPDCFLVGLVGRLTEQKDIPTFLRALQQVPEVQGAVIGGGELQQALQDEAKALNLTNIVFAGPQPDGPDLIGCLDAMVLCSKFEGLGLVLLEAMARHVPIVGTKAGAIPEILDNGNYGRLVNVGDHAALATEIRRFREDTVATQALAATAYARVVEKFTIPAMVRNTTELYEEALGIAPPSDFKKKLAA